MSAPMLELQHAVYRYPRGTFSLSCEKLALYAGKPLLILGANGSGKTTLLRLLSGVCRPNSGRLLLHGADAAKYPLSKIGRTVGFLLQEPSRQLFTTNVWDELTFLPALTGADPEAARMRAESLLTRFSLSALRDRGLYRLSRGEKQRVALAAVLMQSPGFLLLDEPTTGLDREMREALFAALDSLLADGVGFAAVTHDRAMRERFPCRTVAVESGVVSA